MLKKIMMSSLGIFFIANLYGSAVTSSIQKIDSACTNSYNQIQTAKTNYGNLSITLQQYEQQVQAIGLQLYLNLYPLVAHRVIPMQPAIASNPINKISAKITGLKLYVLFTTNSVKNPMWSNPIILAADNVAALNAALQKEQVNISIDLRFDQQNNTIVCWTAYGVSSKTVIMMGDDYLWYYSNKSVVPQSDAPVAIRSNFQASISGGAPKQLPAEPAIGTATIFAKA